MSDRTLGRILCVDDEPPVLKALTRQLTPRYEILTATSGDAALVILDEQPDIPIVVSDLAMPRLSGIDLLREVRQRAPDAVRVLHTGRADLETAAAAVNDGQIFRFLVKPCSTPTLLATMGASMEYHRLVTAERLLLERTLKGSVTILTEILEIANPPSFGRATRVKRLALELADCLDLGDVWELEVAAMMSQLGFITLSASTAERVYFGKDLNSDDQAQLDRVPTVTDNLLANIPRLETVRAMLQRAHGVSPQPTEPSVERRAVALRAALEFDALISNGCSRPDAIEAMRASARPYPRQVIEAVQAVWCDGVRGVAVEAVPWSGLRVGMVLAADIVTTGGTLLAARGFTITERFVERAYQFGTTDVHDDILVIAARRGSQEAESSSHRKAEGEQS